MRRRKKCFTFRRMYDIILYVLQRTRRNTERCPSGRRCLTRNQVWLIATVGSNPTLSAICKSVPAGLQGLFYCPHCRSAYKKSQASKGMSGSLPASFCCLDDLFAVVVTALRANVMRHLRRVALRAGNATGSIELPVGAALIAACLGSLALWYCHLIFTSEVMRSFSEIHAMG